MIGRTNAITIIGGGGGDVDTFVKYHIEQVVTGNNCVLNFTTYTDQQDNNYWVGIVESGNTQTLYIFDEDASGGNADTFVKYHIEQVITNDNCVLNFTTYTNQATNNYWVGIENIGNTQQLYIFDEDDGGGGSSSAILIPKMITIDGTYNALDDNADGYSSVTVDVGSSLGATFKSYVDMRGEGYNLFQNFTTMTSAQLASYMDGIDTSGWTNCSGMFSVCLALTTLPSFDTSNVTNAYNMCSNCSNLTSFSLDMSSMTNTNSMFSYCTSLVNLTLINAYSIMNASMMFSDCENLETVSGLGWSNLTSNSSTDMMFLGCSKLHDIGSLSGLAVNLNLAYSTAWSNAEMANLVASLDDITWTGTSHTLKIGATNLAKLSQSDIADANAKGWTLS